MHPIFPSIHPYKFDCISKPVKEPAKLKALFDSWCLTQSYIERLSLYTPEMMKATQTESAGLKNILACEAHNEVITNTLYMIYESRVEKARDGVEYIKKLQNMEIV